MKRYVLTAAFTAACAIAVQAQNPPTSQQPASQSPTQQPETQANRPASPAGMTTLTGCVYRERDVPGRAPNIAERAGVLEDYILADARPAGESATPATPGATGTSGMAGKMYKLEKIEDDRLKAVVGKRVEVTGRIDAEAGDTARPAPTTGAAQPDRSPGPDRIELPEFEVTSIKEVSGTCPAKPEAPVKD